MIIHTNTPSLQQIHENPELLNPPKLFESLLPSTLYLTSETSFFSTLWLGKANLATSKTNLTNH